ncbi:MAG: hypothetical protein AAES65_19470 [Candidatus Thiodiazotropha sp. (ex. Lucinoma kazani)]
MTGSPLSKDRITDVIYVNVVHTVDGAWNLDGLAMTNEELAAAMAQG